LALFLALTGYFIGVYLYTAKSLDSYRESFADLQTVHERSICLTKLFYFTREDLLTSV
jgi:hypothetical protein